MFSSRFVVYLVVWFTRAFDCDWYFGAETLRKLNSQLLSISCYFRFIHSKIEIGSMTKFSPLFMRFYLCYWSLEPLFMALCYYDEMWAAYICLQLMGKRPENNDSANNSILLFLFVCTIICIMFKCSTNPHESYLFHKIPIPLSVCISVACSYSCCLGFSLLHFGKNGLKIVLGSSTFLRRYLVSLAKYLEFLRGRALF